MKWESNKIDVAGAAPRTLDELSRAWDLMAHTRIVPTWEFGLSQCIACRLYLSNGQHVCPMCARDVPEKITITIHKNRDVSPPKDTQLDFDPRRIFADVPKDDEEP